MMAMGSNLATPQGLIVSIDWKTFKHQYLQSQEMDLDQITHTTLLGSRKGCIFFLGRLDWNSGCIMYVIMVKK